MDERLANFAAGSNYDVLELIGEFRVMSTSDLFLNSFFRAMTCCACR